MVSRDSEGLYLFAHWLRYDRNMSYWRMDMLAARMRRYPAIYRRLHALWTRDMLEQA